jgi:hypothetical protein
MTGAVNFAFVALGPRLRGGDERDGREPTADHAFTNLCD